VVEYHETEEVRKRGDDSLEATLPTKDLPWLAKLVLRLGGEATVLDPPELGEMVRETAEQTLALYRRKR
jgi:proteasome accessory factor C